jgi:hypothetical protein
MEEGRFGRTEIGADRNNRVIFNDIRTLARFPIRWNHLIGKNSRQFKNLGSMSLSEKRVHFSGTCSKTPVRKTC